MNKSKALARMLIVGQMTGQIPRDVTLEQLERNIPPDHPLYKSPSDIETIRLAQERQNRKAAKRATQREYDLYNSSQICHKSATELNDIVSPKQLTQ